jgi:hypothetical protein
VVALDTIKSHFTPTGRVVGDSRNDLYDWLYTITDEPAFDMMVRPTVDLVNGDAPADVSMMVFKGNAFKGKMPHPRSDVSGEFLVILSNTQDPTLDRFEQAGLNDLPKPQLPEKLLTFLDEEPKVHYYA